jgi:ribosomal protein L24E
MRAELASGAASSAAQAKANAGAVQPNITVPPVVVHDANGDGVDPRGDVVTATSFTDAISETFTMTMATPEDPLTDANWLNTNPGTLAGWVADTNFDGNPDHIVLLVRDQNVARLDVGLFNESSGALLCEGTGSYDGRLVARLGSSCPSLHAYKWAAGMVYLGNEDDAPDYPNLSQTTPAVRSGYFMLGGAGHVYGFGNAPEFGGSTPFSTSMATIPDGTGAYVVDTAGHVFTKGRAKYHGGTPALQAGETITTMSVTPDAGGYWLFSNKGRVFHFGNAAGHGDLSGKALNGPIIASVATPDGGGYYMVGSDGGIFTFGNAKFRGSEGGKPLNAPIVGIAPTPDNKGYWLVGTDGGVFTFGDAKFRGSEGGKPLNAPVHGMVAYGNGYLLVASDGGVFDFSNKAFLGSLGGQHLPAPIVDIVAFTFTPA